MLILHKDLKVRERTVWRTFPTVNIASAKVLRLEFDWSIVSTVAEWSEENVRMRS